MTINPDGYSPDAERRRQEIKERRLEIAATLAEWKRAYIVDGKERPFADRCSLEAESARLALELHRIGTVANEAKITRKKRENERLLSQLIAVVNERGLHDVLTEAHARAVAAERGEGVCQ